MRRAGGSRRPGTRHRGALWVAAAIPAVFAGVATSPGACAASVVRIDTPRVEIRFESGDRRVADRVAKTCRDVAPKLAAQLGLARIDPIRVEITRDIGAYSGAEGADLPGWGAAFALMDEQRMLVDSGRATRAWNSLERTIAHELSHLLVAQRVGASTTPLWFLEGLAQWQAGEWTMVDNWQLMSAVWGRRAPPLIELTRRYPAAEDDARTAYRVSYAAFMYRFGRGIDAILPEFLDDVLAEGFGAAFSHRWGETPAGFSGRFDRHLEQRYHTPLLIFQDGPLFGLMAVLFLVVAARAYFWKRRKLRDLDSCRD